MLSNRNCLVSEVLRGILSPFHNGNGYGCITYVTCGMRMPHCLYKSEVSANMPRPTLWLIWRESVAGGQQDDLLSQTAERGELSFSKGQDAGSVGTVNSHSTNWFGTAHKGPKCYRHPDLSVCTVEGAVFRSGRTSTSK